MDYWLLKAVQKRGGLNRAKIFAICVDDEPVNSYQSRPSFGFGGHDNYSFWVEGYLCYNGNTIRIGDHCNPRVT